MINPANSYGYIRETGPVHQSRAPQPAAEVEDMSEAALEQFLSSWSSGVPGSDRMTLDQMLTVQAAASPEIPPPAPVVPKVTNPTDHALRQIESLVRDNRSIFQNHSSPSMTDGWNIAGQR